MKRYTDDNNNLNNNLSLLTTPRPPVVKTKIVNLMATDLTLLSGPDGGGQSRTYRNPGPNARVNSEMETIAVLQPSDCLHMRVPLLEISEQRVVGLPDYEEDAGVLYVVSGAVAGFVKGSRDDVVTPSRIVFDGDRWIVGCKALVRIR